MKKVKLSLKWAIKHVKSLIEEIEHPFTTLLVNDSINNINNLLEFCQSNDITVLFNKDIPDDNVKAFSLCVDGDNFILIDSSIKQKSRLALHVISHEIAHIALGHVHLKNLATYGISEAMHENDYELQEFYNDIEEMSADFVAFLITIPNRVLDFEVERHVFIPARKLAHNYGIDTKWMASRIMLYRQMFGYDRSLELLRNKLKDEYNGDNWDKWTSLEHAEFSNLHEILPSVQQCYLPYLK